MNGLRKERGIGWDDLVIDAVCAHYGLDRLVMALPKAYKPDKKSEEKEEGRQAWKGQGGFPEENRTDQAPRSAKVEISGSPWLTCFATINLKLTSVCPS